MSIDFGDIQANVLRGWGEGEVLPHVAYAFLSFDERSEPRPWLADAAALVTSCTAFDALKREDASDRFVWNLGLTQAGLARLGIDVAKRFEPYPAYVSGALSRSSEYELLGDSGASAPSNWEPHFRDAALHAIVSVSAWAPVGVSRALAVLAGSLQGTRGVKQLAVELGDALAGGVEHFGFKDGISQPHIELGPQPPPVNEPCESAPVQTSWDGVPPGEFVLGYPDVLRHEPATDALLVNGSFLVFRKLHEDVAAFRAFTAALAARTGESEEWLAAKFVGRWRSGAPLALAPERDEPALAANNDFGFEDDPDGYKTPFGAHIRRANPRNSASSPTQVQTAAHRIIRRATPYGPPLPPGATDDGKQRGVLFTVINGDIDRQFEFVQANWINSVISSNTLTSEADKDPLIGANDGTGKLMIPGKDGPLFAWDLPRFVSVRGSAYFFLPSLHALVSLSAAKSGAKGVASE
jgi:Dyp-type peroxidase family